MKSTIASFILFGSAALLSPLLVTTAVGQPAPNAQPMGGIVTQGSATISQQPTETDITQSSPSATIDWASFTVGSQQTVIFTQPDASSAILNNVTGPDPSQIAGRISANADLYLVNQAGITFFQGTQVNAPIFASTSSISARDWASGNPMFTGPINPNSRVVNQGTINVPLGGDGALIGGSVRNSGVINLPGGTLTAGA